MKPEKLLTAISKSAAALFREKNFAKAVSKTLRNLGEATEVSRVYLFENHYGPRGGLLTSQRYEWVAPGITPQIDAPAFQGLRVSRFPGLAEHLRQKPFHGTIKELPRSLVKLLEPQDGLSILLVPVHTDRDWYGFIGFDDCRSLRRWSKAEISTLTVAANILGGAIEHYIDMTAIERADVALRQSEKKYRDLVEKLPEGVSYADEREIIRYANRSYCRILGHRREEITGRPIALFLDEHGKKELMRQARLRKKGIHSRYLISMRSATGEMVTLEVSATPVFDEAGSFRGSYGVFTDVREMRKIDRLKDDLLRDVSHELKAPAANIVMGLNLVGKNRDRPGDDDFSLGLRMIDTGVTRIQRNIDSFMELASIESGVAVIASKRFALCRLLERVVADLDGQARTKGITLDLDCRARKTLRLSGDRERVYLLFSHLVENGIKFSGPGTISISARRSGRKIVVTVADKGKGIHPSYLEKIFERHYQRFTSVPGTGIGLTLSRKIVEMHRGRIWAESPGLGSGMTAHVEFPAAPPRK